VVQQLLLDVYRASVNEASAQSTPLVGNLAGTSREQAVHRDSTNIGLLRQDYLFATVNFFLLFQVILEANELKLELRPLLKVWKPCETNRRK
jgi:hypothetical protein